MLRPLSFIALLMWIALWLSPLAVAHMLDKKKWRGRIFNFACKGILWICGVHVKRVGEPSDSRPLLVVSNHLSYLDIWILGSVMDCRFVPKKEIAHWPVVGWICKMSGAVFLDRSAHKIREATQAISAVLETGEVVAVFPEATTGDGKRLLPFKPALFEAAKGAAIQPVAIAYRKIRGLPIDYGQWPLIAWYGDMVLLPHLWHVLSLGRIDVEVHFLPPLSSVRVDRKELVHQAHSAIEQALLHG